MLTKLLPTQISRFWDIIKYGIEESLPPVAYSNPNVLNNVLSNLLSDKAQCWASYHRDENDTIILEGIIITEVLIDHISMTKNLLIYAMCSFDNNDLSKWTYALGMLAKFAKSQGCLQIIGYTNVDKAIRFAERFGDSTYTFVRFDVNKSVSIFNELGGK